MKILAIIPARGGSKGVLYKNIRLLAKKPLIAYTIQEALKVKEIDRTIVSTDDKQIANVAKKYGAEVPFLRPKNLAKDITPTEPVLTHTLEWLEKKEGYKPDIVVLLQPTSPFRKAKHIKEAINQFLKKDCQTLISVSQCKKYLYQLSPKGFLKPLYKTRKRRQERKPSYLENGAIYITYPSFVKKGKIFGKKISYLIMDPISSLGLDDYLDFEQAEFYLKKKKKLNKIIN